MKPVLLYTLAVCAALVAFAQAEEGALDMTPQVVLETTKGNITLELDRANAPITVESFLENVNEGFYDNTVFHRVIKGFMLQAGGHATDGQLKPTDKRVRNEANNGLKNVPGTVAMARKNDPHSASVQFFINHGNNDFLDHTAETDRGWGYAVFGHVVDGMDVVDAIADTPVQRSRLSEAQPLENILITKARVVGE